MPIEDVPSQTTLTIAHHRMSYNAGLRAVVHSDHADHPPRLGPHKTSPIPSRAAATEPVVLQRLRQLVHLCLLVVVGQHRGQHADALQDPSNSLGDVCERVKVELQLGKDDYRVSAPLAVETYFAGGRAVEARRCRG